MISPRKTRWGIFVFIIVITCTAMACAKPIPPEKATDEAPQSAPSEAEAVTTGQYVADSGDQSIHEANYGASTETVAVAELTDNAIRFDAVPALFPGEFKNLFTAGKRYAFYLDAASGGQRGINVKDDTGVWRTFTYRVTVQ